MGKALSIFKRRRYQDTNNESPLGGGSNGGRPKRAPISGNIFTEIPPDGSGDASRFNEKDFASSTNHVRHGVIGGTCLDLMDGDLCVTGGRDNSIIVQSYENLQIRHKWLEHTRDVIKISSFQDQVVSGSRDATIAVWKIGEENCIDKLTDHQLAVTSVDFDHRHGNTLVSGSRDNTVKFWDMTTLDCLSSVTESRNLVTNMKWKRDSDTIAQTSEDKTLKLWDGRTHEIVHTFATQQQIPTCCDIKDNYCITGYNGFVGEGCQLYLWDIRQLNIVGQYLGHQETVTSCSFLPDDDSNLDFVSSSNDGSVRIWNKDLTSSIIDEKLQSGPLTAVKPYNHNSLVVTSLVEGVKKFNFHHGSG